MATKAEVDQQFSGPQAVTTEDNKNLYDKPQARENGLAKLILPFVLLGLLAALLGWVLLRV